MANQQVYQAYPQSKGTLIPGQTISVNNYTVQVERYLSQGGFAHVYLVRTPAPVYNTTHHVLKRIAVANEAMLTEVKKEVDIMRLLKGHPNIVHFIDAAWHKLPNGTFEVFILMEYCPGGGIIDMMNRRLRERLTEAEILQIFVDVCEGVAYMHSSRPPLLHRDLKVENILQSSATSYKLCDFGSAATVQNPPTNMQEIRALEADLNKHTTLQYRAPEMVDVYSKRPINEKSDVWALGVLLYKLCYYTTPFEEHGPLAILNVQYRIPPFPVYSQDMNMLIASMLREHGAQRPSVFELLNHVHRLRGTKSKFTYNVPIPPPLFPRGQSATKSPPVPNPLDGLVTYTSSPGKGPTSAYDTRLPANPPIANQGVQARDKVLDAIAPMRRGRPTASQAASSRPSSPQKPGQSRQNDKENATNWSSDGFGAEQDKAWQAVTQKSANQRDVSVPNDGWVIVESEKKVEAAKSAQSTGFGDDFAEKLWKSADPNSAVQPQSRLSPMPNISTNIAKPTDSPISPLAFTGASKLRVKPERLAQNRNKDAFEGLGLMTSAPKAAPTLGEARKLRTGLAVMSVSPTQENYYRNAGKSSANSIRPSPSPQGKYLSLSPVQTQTISPVPTPGSSSSNAYLRPSPSPSKASPSPAPLSAEGPNIESRFPSLEELDARFNPSSSQPVNALYPSAVVDASPRYTTHARLTEKRPAYIPSAGNLGSSGTGGNLLKPSSSTNVPRSIDGVRSEQVTGVAMRDLRESRKPESLGTTAYSGSDSSRFLRKESPLISLQDESSTKPLGVKKRRSSVNIESSSTGSQIAGAVNKSLGEGLPPPRLPPRPSASPATESPPLTDNLAPPRLPPRSTVSPTVTSQHDWLTGEDPEETKVTKLHTPSDVPILRESPSKRASFIESSNFVVPSSVATQHAYPSDRLIDDSSADVSPTVAKFKKSFPEIEQIDTEKANQPSSSGLTDNWSPITARKGVDSPSSSEDEGPEEPKGSVVPSVAQKRQAYRAKGRQSSVHELVSQYGGGNLTKEKEKERERLPQPGPFSVGDYKPERVKSTGLVHPATSESSRKTPSPTGGPIKTATKQSNPPSQSSSRPQPQANKERPQPPPIATKPSTSSRSRPQSMFLFPSKSTDSSTSPTTTNLLPPQEAKPRAVRRTSISDMVQRYEAIGGSSKPPTVVSPASPLPLHKATSSRPINVPAENGLPRKLSQEHIGYVPPASSLSTDTFVRATGESSESRPVKFEPARATHTGLSRTPTKAPRKFTTEMDRPTSGASPTPDKNALRQRRTSIKTELSTPSHSRSESVARTPKLSVSETSKLNISPRKPPISLNDEEPAPAPRPEDRSPSPDRPYQGVGRLIDQWQKKSAEATQPQPVPPGKRKDVLPRRAGIVRGDDR
ncbi:hypothetical protein CVT26_009302 [Gymnopilus dilepis]|uniref:non-specific serine/threonine protein kinase n=1 Tax=Gymnopilus dilepis TaxID=231916 RepID=A0A409YAB2_9AGAR|nr:hypothetical protein CVT26_009302 [Gymnopilus dilepis]